ncbi:fumarylacetoacetate hydrolase family protein [Methylotetracoccus oryzae]|uniref:fumarylacetoacetate hydrolase family protein n=1 Tax=Methylotetracoccus oryzae TaxID=1919059 RepID=UPI001118B8D2|nr:fumarylacetoacetate hydrolase family protein [Methylotetracoccus oryzae]
MFPIERQRTATPTIFGIGRNYAQHAREMGNPLPLEPVVFLKPGGSLIDSGGTIALPPQSADVQHEVEIVLLLGSGGRHLSVDQAWSAIAGYGVGIDVTARDMQRVAQAAGNPWSIAKGFDTFAPVSKFAPAACVRDPLDLRFELTVNGEVRQSGTSADMIFSSGALVSYLSSIFTLRPGDLVFTGTPEGVGRINPGDRLVARLSDFDISLMVDAAVSAP